MIPGVTFPQTTPVKVFQCIPNIGHTEALAYDNRLVANQRHGAREERARWVHALHRPETGLAQAEAGRLLELVTGHPYDQVVAEHRTWYEFYTVTVGEVLTPFAREMLVDRALEMGSDLIYMIDDDMIGAPDTFFRIATGNCRATISSTSTRSRIARSSDIRRTRSWSVTRWALARWCLPRSWPARCPIPGS